MKEKEQLIKDWHWKLIKGKAEMKLKNYMNGFQNPRNDKRKTEQRCL